MPAPVAASGLNNYTHHSLTIFEPNLHVECLKVLLSLAEEVVEELVLRHIGDVYELLHYLLLVEAFVYLLLGQANQSQSELLSQLTQLYCVIAEGGVLLNPERCLIEYLLHAGLVLRNQCLCHVPNLEEHLLVGADLVR